MQWAKALRCAGRAEEAAQVYARVIQKRPSQNAWLAASEALIEAGDTETALAAYEKAFPIDERPDFAAARLAHLNIALGRYDKAKALNDRLRETLPNDPDIGLRASSLMRKMGDPIGAKSLLLELWAQHSAHGGLAAAMLRDGKSEARETAQNIANDEAADADQRRNCAFALCSLADREGESDAAWAWATLANSLYPKSNKSLSGLRGKLDKAIEAYGHIPSPNENADGRNTKMLYIVSPPHSGGELLQDILSGHPQLRSVGARAKTFSLLSPLLETPKKLAEQIKPLARADIAALTRSAGMADYIVDRSPYYVLLIGVLAKLHAGAQFIAPHRDESDMAVSLFFHDFGDDFPFTRSLSGIQEYLDFHEAALIRWREAGVNIISYNHDRFVADMSTRGEALCKALGLNWSEDLQEALGLNSEAVSEFVSFKGRGEHYASHLLAAGFVS